MNRREGGYVLFLVAVTVALLSVVLVTTAQILSNAARDVRAQRAAAAAELDAQSLMSRISFLLLTEPINGRAIVVGGDRASAAALNRVADPRAYNATGLREVRLDGRLYAAGAQAIVSIQDEAGLLDLNRTADLELTRALEGAGVSRRNARALAATLNDYVDEDGLVRAGGAEAPDYRRAGLDGPLNARLQTPWEAASALGWRRLLGERQRTALWRIFSASADGAGVNVNTAPYDVLAAILGDERVARDLIARREEIAFADLEETGIAQRGSADGAALAVRAGPAFRVLIAYGGAGSESRDALEGQATFARDGADRPIYWRNVRRVRVAKDLDRSNGIERLPDGAALFAP